MRVFMLTSTAELYIYHSEECELERIENDRIIYAVGDLKFLYSFGFIDLGEL